MFMILGCLYLRLGHFGYVVELVNCGSPVSVICLGCSMGEHPVSLSLSLFGGWSL